MTNIVQEKCMCLSLSDNMRKLATLKMSKETLGSKTADVEYVTPK